MNFQDLIKQREAFSEKGQGALLERVKALQGALYSSLLEKIIAELETDESGKIRFTVSNIKTAGKLTTIWAAHQQSSNRFVKWIVEQLIKLFDLNTEYAKAVSKVTDSQADKTKRLLLANLGYDLEKNAVIPDSWLANLGGSEVVKQTIASKIGAAIQSGIPLKQFRNDFKNDFLGKGGLGYLERYYNQKTFDLFQTFDRSAQFVYKKELGMEFAIYSGTLMEPVKGKTNGTRPFCWRRVGNLYDEKTIESWNAQEWSGKIEGSDVKITAGGYQCRHHLSWVSKEMAETLQKRGKELNKLNPPKPAPTK